MLTQYSATITTSDAGNATVYVGSRCMGRVHAIKYAPGTLDTGADLTITGETTGVPIIIKGNAGTSTLWWYPHAIPSKNTDGSAFTDASVPIYVYLERIKVVVVQGGNALTGTITIWVDEPDA